MRTNPRRSPKSNATSKRCETVSPLRSSVVRRRAGRASDPGEVRPESSLGTERGGVAGAVMHWRLSHRADPLVRVIADQHYNRQKIGSPQFVPPGRCLVLGTDTAFWITSWPFAEFVRHAWAGAMVCSAFRNEGDVLSSILIVEALAATRWKYPELPELGMVTFVNAAKVREKRDPGYCFLRAGFKPCGKTKGGLHAFQILPSEFPEADTPIDAVESLKL